MDPVDFTKPEAFAQSGAKLAESAAPGAQETSAFMAWLIALRDRLGRRPDGAQAASISMQGGAAPIEISGRPTENAGERSAAESSAAESMEAALEAALKAEAARSAAPRRPARPGGSGLMKWIVLAPLSWLALAGLLSALDLALAGTAPSEILESPDFLQALSDPAFVARMELLARMSAEMLYWPVLALMALTLLRGVFKALLTRPSMPEGAQPAQALLSKIVMLFGAVLSTIKVVPMVATACAALGALVAGLAFLNNQNHWDALPWVHPPYVESFIARHPDLTVGDFDGRSDKRVVRDTKGRTISLHSTEMDGAHLSFAPCPAKLGAQQLGGIPPYPGMACTSVATLRNELGTQTHYQFHQATGSNSQAIVAHFQAWVDKHAGSSAMGSTGDYLFNFSASARDDDSWKLTGDSRKGGATTIVIEHRQDAAKPQPPRATPTPGKAAIKLNAAPATN